MCAIRRWKEVPSNAIDETVRSFTKRATSMSILSTAMRSVPPLVSASIRNPSCVVRGEPMGSAC